MEKQQNGTNKQCITSFSGFKDVTMGQKIWTVLMVSVHLKCLDVNLMVYRNKFCCNFINVTKLNFC